MTNSEGPVVGIPAAHVNFDATASLRKWPSLNNRRRTEGSGPYLLLDDTLDGCIRGFMAKPSTHQHLYEIHTVPQPPLVADVLSGEIVAELARRGTKLWAGDCVASDRLRGAAPTGEKQ